MSIADAFDRAVDYDRHAIVQRRVAEELAGYIASLPLASHPSVLEIGCGTGLLGGALIGRITQGPWLMTDIAPAMVARTAARFADHPRVRVAMMDGEHPTGPERFDLICSSLAMQWFGDLAGAIGRLRARLAPHGLMAFTTLVDGSFAEWRTAHGDEPAGTHDYPSAAALEAMGLAVTVKRHLLRHADARDFLRSLKAIGAQSPRPGYRALSPGALRRVMARFEAAGSIATYRVATCTVRAAA